MKKKHTRETHYSTDLPGDRDNHKWPAQCDFTDGYIGITQAQPEPERVLLTPRQFDELVRFVEQQRDEGEE